jgi:hypothetical protein
MVSFVRRVAFTTWEDVVGGDVDQEDVFSGRSLG